MTLVFLVTLTRKSQPRVQTRLKYKDHTGCGHCVSSPIIREVDWKLKLFCELTAILKLSRGWRSWAPSTMVKENLQMPYQAVSLYTPSHYPCFSGIVFSFLSFFSFLLISFFSLSSFLLCFVSCFHRLAIVYSRLSILDTSGHLMYWALPGT